MINLSDYAQLTGIRDVSKVFDSTEYAKWKSFRASDDSRYVALTLPHVLMREPYGRDTRQIDEFAFEEGVDGKDHSKYLWGNAAYALAARLTQFLCEIRLVRFDSRRGERRSWWRVWPRITSAPMRAMWL